MLSLIPVVEVRLHEHSFEWASSNPAKEWVELGGATSESDIALVVSTLATYNGIASSGPLVEVARALENADCMVLPGGLMVRTTALEIAPSCCCGLEGWRQWYGVKPGGSSPWLGHDPSPGVICNSDVAIFVADGDTESSPRISITYSDVDSARRSANEALVAFASRLSEWLAVHAPLNVGLSKRFAEDFDII